MTRGPGSTWKLPSGERVDRLMFDRMLSAFAELKADQTDQDVLPPYDVLDPILRLYVEEDRSAREICDLGYDEALVQRIIRMVDMAEYKRRQSPPGIKITPRAFGKDRRLPITNRWRG